MPGMAKLYGHLVERNSKMAVCYTTTAYTEPVEIRFYYLSDVTATIDNREFIGCLVSRGPDDGNRWHIANSSRWLDTNGQAEREESPIPPPKTRLPVRWNGEVWEKLTRKGWTTA